MSLFFSCSKNVPEWTEENLNSKQIIDETSVGINVSNAFAYATNLGPYRDNSTKSNRAITNPDTIEKKMLSNLSYSYGKELTQTYYDNKKDCTPDLSNYESLQKISFEGYNEKNPKEFINKVFSSTKPESKSANFIYFCSMAMQNNIDDLSDQINNCAQAFAIDCIDNGSINENEFKSELLNTVQNYRETVDFGQMTTNEKEKLRVILATLENSLENFVDYATAIQNEESKSGILLFGADINKGWLKNLVQTVVKIVGIAVCLTVGVIAGVALGMLTPEVPALIIVDVSAGLIAGGIAAMYWEDWVMSW
jgi:hypothetical protein